MLAKQITRRTPRQFNSRVPANMNNRTTSVQQIMELIDLLDLPRSGANDNVMRSLLTRRSALGLAGRIGLRAIPWIGTALLLYELWEYFSKARPEGFTDLGPWSEYARGPNPVAGAFVRQSVAFSTDAIATQINSNLPLQPYTAAGADPAQYWNVSTSVLSVIFGNANLPGVKRCALTVGYSRPSTGAIHVPTYQAASMAKAVLPVLTPHVAYELALHPAKRPVVSLPLASPLPAVPWADAPHWEHPNREVGYHPPASYPQGWSYPVDVIPNSYAVTHSFNGRPANPPRNHERDRPPPRQREVKAKVPAAMVPLIRAVNFVTEANDFVDAIYQALPAEFRPRWKDTPYEWRNPTPQAKLQAVFDNYDKLDAVDIIENLIFEHFEDRFYGMIGRKNAETSKRLGLLYGAGLNSLSTVVRKTVSEYRDYDKERNQKESK